MQYQSFDWLRDHEISTIIPCLEIAAINSYFGVYYKMKPATSSIISGAVLIKQLFNSLRYGIIIANSALTRLSRYLSSHMQRTPVE